MSTQYAQSVCLNGHQQADDLYWGQQSKSFCEKCGAEVISTCPNCNYPIPGDYDPSGNGVLVLSPKRNIPVPSYCKNCGHPYPWTQTAIDSAQELIEMSDLDSKDKVAFKETIPNIMTDTPRTKLAITKFKIYAKKAGNIIGDGLRDILVDVASEAAKKIIWGV